MRDEIYSTVNDALKHLKAVFRDKRGFLAFVIFTLALLARAEGGGNMSSAIRTLMLDPGYYRSIDNFFKWNLWDWKELRRRWRGFVRGTGRLGKVNGRIVIEADGTIRASDGRFMPGARKTRKSSGSASKQKLGSFFPGVLHGGVSVIAESPDGSVRRAVPLGCAVHSGDDPEVLYDGKEKRQHYLKMAMDAVDVALGLGEDCYIVMDALHFKQEVWKYLNLVKWSHPEIKIDFLIRVGKAASVRLDGEKKNVRIYSLFDSRREDFVKTEVETYGGTETLSLLTVEAVWGARIKQRLSFVLSKRETGEQCVFACSDLSVGAENAVRIYALREKIEDCFRTMKQTFHNLGGHFWTRAEEKTRRFDSNRKNNERRAAISDGKRIGLIKRTWEATLRMAQVNCIAVGITTLVSLEFSSKDGPSFPTVWKRTYTPGDVTPLDVKRYFERTMVPAILEAEWGTPLSLARAKMVKDPCDPEVARKCANVRERGKEAKKKKAS